MTRRIELCLLLLFFSACAGAQRSPQSVQEVESYVQESETAERALSEVLQADAVLDCGEAGRLRDQICVLSEKICGIAERRLEKGELCRDSRERCDRARENVQKRCL